MIRLQNNKFASGSSNCTRRALREILGTAAPPAMAVTSNGGHQLTAQRVPGAARGAASTDRCVSAGSARGLAPPR